MNYEEKYYSKNLHDGDRPALWGCERFVQRYLDKDHVSEFCCGVGYFARRLSRHAKVCCLELSHNALDHIQKTAPEMRVLPTTSMLADKAALHQLPDEKWKLEAVLRASCALMRFLLSRPLARQGDDENLVFALEARS